MEENDTREAKWYDKFVKKTDASRGSKKPRGSKGKKPVRRERAAAFAESGRDSREWISAEREAKPRGGLGAAAPMTRSASGKERKREWKPRETIDRKRSARLVSAASLFDARKIPADARAVLENFDRVAQEVFPASARQLSDLPQDIRRLSHTLTDMRRERETAYMSDAPALSGYARYFTWWNLVRLARLFSNLGDGALNLSDGDVCVDMGSGPLTVVMAMWLALPALREKDLTWICVDISQGALSLGEDLYMSIASKAPPRSREAKAHWKIVRAKKRIGDEIREKAALVTCVNMLNELQERERLEADRLVQKYIGVLHSYCAKNSSVLVVEPGVPAQARVISLARDALIEKGMRIVAPCPHERECPMDGFEAKLGGKSKWCNFAFKTGDAPQKLLALSAESGIPKERAVMSFVLATNFPCEESAAGKKILRLRIASDPIYLPGYRTGYYACCALGLALVIDVSGNGYSSGDVIEVEPLVDPGLLPRDKKTGAVTLNV